MLLIIWHIISVINDSVIQWTSEPHTGFPNDSAFLDVFIWTHNKMAWMCEVENICPLLGCQRNLFTARLWWRWRWWWITLLGVHYWPASKLSGRTINCWFDLIHSDKHKHSIHSANSSGGERPDDQRKPARDRWPPGDEPSWVNHQFDTINLSL